MLRVRRIVEGGELLVMELAPNGSLALGASNTNYLLEYYEYEEMKRDAAIGKAIREHAEKLLYPDEENSDGTD